MFATTKFAVAVYAFAENYVKNDGRWELEEKVPSLAAMEERREVKPARCTPMPLVLYFRRRKAARDPLKGRLQLGAIASLVFDWGRPGLFCS